MVEELADGQRMTLGADKANHTADFVAEMRRLGRERQRPAFGHRWPHHAPSRLVDQRARAQARGSVRLDRDGGRVAQERPHNTALPARDMNEPAMEYATRLCEGFGVGPLLISR